MALNEEMKARMEAAKTSKQDAEALKKKIQAEKDAKAAKVKADILSKQRAAAKKIRPMSGRPIGATGMSAPKAAGQGLSIRSGIPGMQGMGSAAAGSKIISEYTVKKGDTLSQIAKDFYGSGGAQYYKLIQEANKDLIKDVNLIYPGQVFKIPELPANLKK